MLPSYQEEESAWQKLGKEGFAGRLMVQEKQRRKIEAEQDLKAQGFTVQSLRATVAQSQTRLAQVASNYRQQLQTERVQVQMELAKLKEELAKQEHKNALLELKAPQPGKIKDVGTHTEGTVVSPGTILVTIVPVDEPLQAEVFISNEDVGFVKEGQSVEIKLGAYPFQKYGLLKGRIAHVSADAGEMQPDRKAAAAKASLQETTFASAYRSIVELSSQHLSAQRAQFELAPGMRVVAEIKLGERAVVEYLLSPLRVSLNEAGREK